MRVQRVQQNAGRINELLIDAKRGILVTGDEAGVIQIWRLDEPAELLRDVEPPFLCIDALDWLPDRSGFVATGPTGLGAWRLDGSSLGAWPAVEAVPQSIAVVDSKRALVAYDDSRLRLVDFATGAVLSETEAGERNSGIARHPDGRRFCVSACDQGGSAIRFVALEGLELHALRGATISRDVDHLSTPAIDATGRRVMVADHRLHVFDVDAGVRIRSFDPRGRRVRWLLRERLLVEQPWTQCTAVGPSGVACASPEGSVFLFDTETSALSRYDDLERPAWALAADGPVLAAASVDWSLVIWWP